MQLSKHVFCEIVLLHLRMKVKLFPLGVQWVVKGAVDVNIGANPSAEGGEDEGVDDTAVKVVDIVDVFRLQVRATMNISLSWRIHF